MDNDEVIAVLRGIRNGSATVTVAPDEGIQSFWTMHEQFCRNCLGYEASEMYVSDLSTISDFAADEEEVEEIHKRVREIFGVDISGVKDPELVWIYQKIEQTLRGGRPQRR